MLDFRHILDQPNANIQLFVGGKNPGAGTSSAAPYTHWETWIKPRGVRWIYMMAVGSGGAGGAGTFTIASASPAGGGGGSGGMTTCLYPAFFVPDTLFIDVGAGGQSANTSAQTGGSGTNTDIRAEIGISGTSQAHISFCFANGGTGGGGSTTATVGGIGGTGASTSGIGNSICMGRGIYSSYAGQTGSAGGTNGTFGVNLVYPTTGLCVTAGTGGGGGGNVGAYGGGGFIGPGANNAPDFAPYGNSRYLPGAPPAPVSTPGTDGWNQLFGLFNGQGFIMNRGGAGGGGSSSLGDAAVGGTGAPGCGGGGSGGGTTNGHPTIAPSGAGGPGFAIIISF